MGRSQGGGRRSRHPLENAIVSAAFRLLTSEEVAPLDKQQLRVARNEIYARRGRKFVIQEVREYFEQFDWYDPRFGEVELTYIEQSNVDLIRGFEK